jgi:hypothetical protein
MGVTLKPSSVRGVLEAAKAAVPAGAAKIIEETQIITPNAMTEAIVLRGVPYYWGEDLSFAHPRRNASRAYMAIRKAATRARLMMTPVNARGETAFVLVPFPSDLKVGDEPRTIAL